MSFLRLYVLRLHVLRLYVLWLPEFTNRHVRIVLALRSQLRQLAVSPQYLSLDGRLLMFMGMFMALAGG